MYNVYILLVNMVNFVENRATKYEALKKVRSENFESGNSGVT